MDFSATSQFRLPRSTRLLCAALLSVSLSCNVGALFLPFITLRKGLNSDPYSLFHTVSMLWDKGLFVLAVLVVGFSILFPFAKLGVLAWTLRSPEVEKKKIRWLHRVERAGKWSMLDVFLVAIILSLASQQFLLGAKPQLGLNLFIAAILLSMLTGELMARHLTSPNEASSSPETNARGGVLLALSGITLVASLTFPFLRIEDWLLSNREYSILTLVPALWRQDAMLASSLAAIFLLAAPLLAWAAGFELWYRKSRGLPSNSRAQWARRTGRWSMLEVFGFALTVFALESDSIMRTEIRWGALFLGATLALQMAFTLAFERAVEIKRETC